MYEAHPVFTQPSNEHVKVWRYMDFTKLVSLLDSRQLYFTRSDKVGDPFEGSWPKINVAARQQVPDIVPPEARENFLRAMAMLGEHSRKWARCIAINCWHMNEHESAAMWKLYLKSDEGVSIQSTYSKLRESFLDDERIFLGVVNYIDYDSEWIDAGNALTPFVHKRRSFEHEREVRALVARWPSPENGMDFDKGTIAHGVKIRVAIEKMVERVFVAPSAPEWFAELVSAVVNRYGYGFQVVQSKLDEQPVF